MTYLPYDIAFYVSTVFLLLLGGVLTYHEITDNIPKWLDNFFETFIACIVTQAIMMLMIIVSYLILTIARARYAAFVDMGNTLLIIYFAITFFTWVPSIFYELVQVNKTRYRKRKQQEQNMIKSRERTTLR